MTDKLPKPSPVGRGLLTPEIWTNPGESTNPDDYRKPVEPVVEAKTIPILKGRGMSSCVFYLDDLCYPPEVLLFEMKNVKFWRVDYVKDENGFYHGPLEQGDLYAVDVECGGKVERFSLAFNIRHGEKTQDVLIAIRHAIETWKADSEKISQYLPDDVRAAIMEWLHNDASQIAQQFLMKS